MSTIKGKPRGYFEKLIAMDCETTGLCFNGDDPSVGNQSLAWGMIIADAVTLKPIDELYVEIKWDGESEWADRAEKLHGMSRAYLEENGMTEEEAVIKIGNFIAKHFGTDNKLCCLGHNVATFDIWFLKRLFRKFGVDLRFGNRHVDTSSIGFVNWELFNSDQLFEMVGFDPRGKHNALDDARMSLESARITRTLFRSLFDE